MANVSFKIKKQQNHWLGRQTGTVIGTENISHAVKLTIRVSSIDPPFFIRILSISIPYSIQSQNANVRICYKNFKMELKLKIMLQILILLSLLGKFTSSFDSAKFSLSSQLISNILRKHFSDHKLLLVEVGMKSTLKNQTGIDHDFFLFVPQVSSTIAGLRILTISKEFSCQFGRPSVSTLPMTQVVIILAPFSINSEYEQLLHSTLNLPLQNPSVAKNLDKFIIVTKNQLNSEHLYSLNFIQKLKYKIFLIGHTPIISQFCLHCQQKVKHLQLSNQSTFSNELSLSQIYPDFQRNYFGYTLKASATDKMFAHFQYSKNPSTGKWSGKRGVFNFVLNNLAAGLNFTPEIYPASGGGATGTRLPNGTWIGSVGDVYIGNASFCMLCSMGLERHTVVDMASPVTFEYIRFAIGPSEKVYTWQSIFWSFDKILWLAMLIVTIITVLFGYLFLRLNRTDCQWTAQTLAQYFGMVFVEQSDTIPVSLPESVRITLGFWLLFALVTSTAYKAKMVGFMTFPVMEQPPNTYKELVKSNYEIQFHYFPSIVYNSFQLSPNPVLHATFEKMLKEPDLIKCLKRVITASSVCITWTSALDDMINRNLSDKFGRSPIRSSAGYAFLFTPGIVLEKMADNEVNFKWILGNCLEMGLNYWWKQMDSQDLLQKRNKWMNQMEGRDREKFVFKYGDADENGDGLKLKHLKGAMAVWGTGIMFSVVVAILEHFAVKATRLQHDFACNVGGKL